MTHIEKAQEFLDQQYHCSQAIAGAFAEEFGFNKKNVMKSLGFYRMILLCIKVLLEILAIMCLVLRVLVQKQLKIL